MPKQQEDATLMNIEEDKVLNDLAKNSQIDTIESLEIDYASGLPVWVQIKNRLSYLIASGEYQAGDRLPTVRALALKLDISYNTVNRSYMDLEREGYISTRKGRGTFVAEIEKGNLPIIDETVTMLTDEMIRSAKNAGMGDEDITAMVKSRLDVSKGK